MLVQLLPVGTERLGRVFVKHMVKHASQCTFRQSIDRLAARLVKADNFRQVSRSQTDVHLHHIESRMQTKMHRKYTWMISRTRC